MGAFDTKKGHFLLFHLPCLRLEKSLTMFCPISGNIPFKCWVLFS